MTKSGIKLSFNNTLFFRTFSLFQTEQNCYPKKGITLLGGQNTCIALARTVISRTELYVLHDLPFALEAAVADRTLHNVLGPDGLPQNHVRTNRISPCPDSAACANSYPVGWWYCSIFE